MSTFAITWDQAACDPISFPSPRPWDTPPHALLQEAVEGERPATSAPPTAKTSPSIPSTERTCAPS